MGGLTYVQRNMEKRNWPKKGLVKRFRGGGGGEKRWMKNAKLEDEQKDDMRYSN